MESLVKTDMIRVLEEFSKNCFKCKSVGALVTAIESVLDKLIPTEYTGLYLFDPKSAKLKLIHAKGFTEEERLIAEQTAMERHPGKVFRDRKLINVPDVSSDDTQQTIDSPRSFDVGSRLYLPVMGNTDCLGAFGVVSSEKHRFSENDITVFSFISNLAGLAYQSLLEEEKKKETERQLMLKERAVSSSNDGIIITDPTLPDNPVIYVNKAFENITGYSFSEVYMKNLRILHSDDIDQPGLQILRNSLNEEKACSVVLENRKKDGTRFRAELSISPVFDEQGKLINYVGIQNDVTRRIINEQNLKLITARISQLIENMPTGVLLEDEHRRIVLANEEFCSMFGIKEVKEELIGVSYEAITGNSKNLFSDEQGFLRGINLCITDGKLKKNKELYLKDGRVFEMDYIPIVLDDDYRGHLWNYRDITKRKEYERDIVELKRFYEQTLHDLPGQIAVFDADFRYLYVNPGSVKDDNLRQWLIGKDDYDYCRFRGLDMSVAEARRERLQQVKQKKQALHFEEKIEKPEGPVFFYERVISPILDDNNEISKYLAYGIDITEVKNLISNLEYSNKSLTEFAYIASHDLREPLRKISVFGNLLNKSLTGKLNEDERENLDFMIDGAKRMQQMVDDLLVYSRATSRPAAFNPVDLDKVLDTILAFNLSEAISEKGAEIIREGSLGIIQGEETHFQQLLQNLISNALKYMREGVTPVIAIRALRGRGKLRIDIGDNGIGIPEKYHEQIFEMFKRLHGRTEYSGSGIGLAVCKKIIENYSGIIKVDSVPGVGSTFRITLPLKKG